ncbi:hypothetical protein [Methylophaga sp. OBS1]|uniref:hypothetical protein n=1 Tax=Methylophaga sp. OBS1 TaxID=2991933 RepID=UPI00224E7F2C|nr:hypothetical protein [Methylophaga sp. OBS1]MCX4192308.1 hypothetical protein [Methylophaga sp. OBS1]
MLITNNEPRFNISAYISVPKQLQKNVTEMIGESLTALYGGLSISETVGFWSSKGNEYIDRYPADELSNHTLQIQLTVLPQQLNKAISDIESVLSEVKNTLGLKARFVHLEVTESKVFHLDLAE